MNKESLKLDSELAGVEPQRVPGLRNAVGSLRSTPATRRQTAMPLPIQFACFVLIAVSLSCRNHAAAVELPESPVVDAGAPFEPYSQLRSANDFSGEFHFHVHEPSAMQSVTLALTNAFAAGWIFILGTCLGSFLNVVIYRLPVGMALGKPKSRCPGCETPLAARDNIPVLGWLILKGRCRYCGMKISPRYPIIEATVGLLFLGLFFAEFMSGGRNLPVRPPDLVAGNPIDQMFLFGQWNLFGIYLFHCCWLTLVLATVMIGYDGHRTPSRLVTFGILTALIGGVIWPDLRPVHTIEPQPEWLHDAYWGFRWQMPMGVSRDVLTTGVGLSGVIDGLAGLAAGILAAAVTWIARRDSSVNTPQHTSIAFVMVLSGSFLGWQAVGSLLLLCLPVLIAVELTGSESLLRQMLPALFLLTAAFLVGWRWLDVSAWMIGHDGWSFTPAGAIADWAVTSAILISVPLVMRQGGLGC